ncbi:WD40 repeat domain-containing protein [Kribbella sp. NBC_01484]|uniref:WD40 repeat domain-containing protein n=1 Tax=Kribbella sp. NBC_01484 TaxID=2903579 RepID=UPI002E31CD76|nr:WD40 repeat domain-containing protein [Kribbella sp. NBC_01484]
MSRPEAEGPIDDVGVVARGDVTMTGEFVAARDIYFNNVTFVSPDGSPTSRELEPEGPAGPCPYAGLDPYDEHTAEFFYGREPDITAVLRLVERTSLVALVGSSGSGKSSILSAGVLPALAQGVVAGSAQWDVLRLRPGQQPLDQLAERITAKLPGTDLNDVAASIRADPKQFTALSSQLKSATGVLWVIDQLEEIFQPAVDADTRAAFLAALSAAQSSPGLKVIIALRSDFYPHLDQSPELAMAIAAAQYRLVRLGEHAIREVVERPAEKVGMTVEPELVEQILKDVGDVESALPLLSYALQQTWRRSHGRRLTLAAYSRSGALDGAIDRAAEKVWNSLSAQQQATTHRVMLRLSYLGEAAVPVRRQAHLDDLVTDIDDHATVIEVVNQLAAARILTVDRDQVGGSTTVDITHEAVLRAWRLLARWLTDDRDTKRAQEDLTDGALAWQEHEKDAGYLLSGARLVAVEAGRRTEDLTFNELELRYLGESRRVDRRRKLRSQLSAVLAVGLVIALAVTFVVVRQQRQIAREKVVADALQLAAQSRSVVERQRDLGALLAVAATRTNDNTVTREAVMDSVASRNGPVASLLPAPVQATALAPALTSGGSALVGAVDGTIHVVDPGDGRQTAATMTGHQSNVTAIAFDGDLVASGDATGVVLVHGLGTTEPLVPGVSTSAEGARIPAIAVDERTDQVFAATTFGAVERWQRRDHLSPMSALPGSSNIISLAVDDASGQIAAINNEGTLLRWRLSDGVPLPALTAPGDLTAGLDMRLAVLRGSRLVAIANGFIGVWDLKTARRLGWTAAPGTTAVSATGDPDLVMVGDSSGAITPWRLGTSLSAVGPVRYGLTGTVISVAANTGHLVGVDESGRALSWDLSGRGSPAAALMAALDGNARTAAVSAAGDVAIGGVDGTVRVFRNHLAIARIPLSSQVNQLLWTPQSSIIAGMDDGRVVQVDPKSRRTTILAADQGRPVVGLSANAHGTVAVVFEDGKVWMSNRSGPPVSVAASGTAIAMGPGGDVFAVASGGRQTGQPPVITVRSTGEGFASQRVLSGHTLEVSSLAFSRDGKYLASGSDDTTIRLWLLEKGITTATLEGHTDMVLGLAFTPDGSVLASGSQDGTIRLWDTSLRRQIGQPLRYADNVQWLSLAPTADGGQFVAADGESAILWPFTPRAWTTRACHFAGREITAQEWSRLGHTDKPPRLCS